MKQTPRKLKALLLLVLMNLEKYIPIEMGLCNMIGQMHDDGLITQDEFELIRSFLYDNTPIYDHNKTGAFWWPAFEIKPRADFINELIQKLDGETA